MNAKKHDARIAKALSHILDAETALTRAICCLGTTEGKAAVQSALAAACVAFAAVGRAVKSTASPTAIAAE